ncbi:potassium transporter TrkG [Nocardiopsis alba]|uniref:TrkH family potassium uptake protein n=3 Tax=Nocardiopsidaceae TaxID=83676 RepID=A0A7K2IVV7_9ACTN|nr:MULTISPECIES: potassium transporter TrkG [Nocardiopsis]AFR11160.1 cation transport family protein [Nocardiopsis alba ATCC BAA-2165]MEC3894316.1 potassium transporter TrkG [Nocardiopsis sp. LDBS1602]MYR34102.1 TrkH family potassium uptake protein [Nocardiopsis alba]
MRGGAGGDGVRRRLGGNERPMNGTGERPLTRWWRSLPWPIRRRSGRFHVTEPGVAQREIGAWRKPARVFLTIFLMVNLAGTLLLMLPVSTTDGRGLDFVPALFTSTTSLAVCGLSVISVGHDLSVFGQVVLMVLMQVGGMGIMTLAAILGTAVIHRFGLRMQLNVQAETRSLWVGEVSGLVRRVAIIFLVVQTCVFLMIAPRMWLAYDMDPLQAAYSALFHAVSSFNNAGLSLYDDSMTRFSGDAFILLPIALAVILGGIGFPVIIELWRSMRRRERWSLHTKLTVTTSAVLIVAGVVLVTLMEWSNPSTLGGLHWWARLTDGFFHGVVPRSGGLNAVPTGEMRDSTLLLTIMLMFVGGGSAGTAGGIKVATLAVLFLVVLSEVRAHDNVHAFGRSLPSTVIRQSLSLVFLSASVVAFGTLLILRTTAFDFMQVLFEVVSAVGVVGLSTGITPDLPPWIQVLLAAFMVAGRIGPITFVTALAFRDRNRHYTFPQARPIIG